MDWLPRGMKMFSHCQARLTPNTRKQNNGGTLCLFVLRSGRGPSKLLLLQDSLGGRDFCNGRETRISAGLIPVRDRSWWLITFPILPKRALLSPKCQSIHTEEMLKSILTCLPSIPVSRSIAEWEHACVANCKNQALLPKRDVSKRQPVLNSFGFNPSYFTWLCLSVNKNVDLSCSRPCWSCQSIEGH